MRLRFDKWSDGVATAIRKDNIQSPTNLKALYMEVERLASVTFTGKVSAQDKSGQTVTVTVTLPSGVEETLTATTQSDGSYTVQKQYGPGGYTAIAHVDADSQYASADSPVVPFTIGLMTRTITLTVNVA